MSVACPLCGATDSALVHHMPRIPVLQNRVYETPELARRAMSGEVSLRCCRRCGFAWNAAYDPQRIVYDASYQNEQGHSELFRTYLGEVLGHVRDKAGPGAKIVEIGCGKGLFLKRMLDAGLDAVGYDPAYEGGELPVVREYFGPGAAIEGDLVLMRHVLEHVPDPLAFLRTIARANGGRGRVFIEVPCFRWIVDRHAFWDVFYEHCNYFSPQSLGNVFAECETGYLFNGQYFYATAPFAALLDEPPASSAPDMGEGMFAAEAERLKRFVREHPGLVVWGAGAKGATFVNLTDPDGEYIRAVVDINEAKQGRFIGGTGHPVVPVRDLAGLAPETVLVMNENYLDEIKEMAGLPGVQYKVLGML